jgi:molybdate transport system ATP-binding protein
MSFHSLSEGQKRLCLIARSLVKSPRLLILDEPCQGLDDHHRARVLRTVDALSRGGRFSLIYVTHDPLEMPACITHTLALDRGMVVRCGSRSM